VAPSKKVTVPVGVCVLGATGVATTETTMFCPFETVPLTNSGVLIEALAAVTVTFWLPLTPEVKPVLLEVY
jgi:hypothetical protein